MITPHYICMPKGVPVNNQHPTFDVALEKARAKFLAPPSSYSGPVTKVAIYKLIAEVETLPPTPPPVHVTMAKE